MPEGGQSPVARGSLQQVHGAPALRSWIALASKHEAGRAGADYSVPRNCESDVAIERRLTAARHAVGWPAATGVTDAQQQDDKAGGSIILAAVRFPFGGCH